MTPIRPLTIAIIGAGFSGALLAVRLLEKCNSGDTIYLIERRPGFGRGLAYSSSNASHLLNVRAGNMSAFPELPQHFVNWLHDRHQDASGVRTSADSFVSRRLYGVYIQSLLSGELKRKRGGGTLSLLPDEAVSLDQTEDGVVVTLAAGNRLLADIAVLATGNLAPDRSIGAYFGDPWDSASCQGIPKNEPVLLIGTGLTMVDTVISLLDAGHEGPIHAISRRGLLPNVHTRTTPLDLDPRNLTRSTSVVRHLRWIRSLARDAEVRGVGWRAAVDGLRPHIPELWRSLNHEQRRRFLRHLRPYWDIHRHRLAPEVHETIKQAIARGQLKISASRIVSITPAEDSVAVAFRPRGKEERQTLTVARAINCSGPETNYESCRDPLLRQVLAEGQARPDPLRLGIDVSEQCALINAEGEASERVFALGPVTRGVFWEIIAVPDIAMHCTRLARHLIDTVRPSLSRQAIARARSHDPAVIAPGEASVGG